MPQWLEKATLYQKSHKFVHCSFLACATHACLLHCWEVVPSWPNIIDLGKTSHNLALLLQSNAATVTYEQHICTQENHLLQTRQCKSLSCPRAITWLPCGCAAIASAKHFAYLCTNPSTGPVRPLAPCAMGAGLALLPC